MRYIALLSLLLNFQITICSIIHVPADQSSIQAGINAAGPGDTVLVAPGTYYESINLSVSGLILASLYLTTGDENYISQTKIDGNNQTVIKVAPPANEATSIIGFTIQNGEDGISPSTRFRLLNNIITACSDGIDYESGSGGICRNNTFRNNRIKRVQAQNELLHAEQINLKGRKEPHQHASAYNSEDDKERKVVGRKGDIANLWRENPPKHQER